MLLLHQILKSSRVLLCRAGTSMHRHQLQQQQQNLVHHQQRRTLLLLLTTTPTRCYQQQQHRQPSFVPHNPRSRVYWITATRWHGGDSSVPHDAPTINVTFLQPDGITKITVPARIGESILETAHRNDIDLEGACEGVCACSTCHIILPHTIYKSLPEASENEEDMLDMAFGLTETSRLGCQIKVTNDMNDIMIEMPKATRNFYVDGHKPKPH